MCGVLNVKDLPLGRKGPQLVLVAPIRTVEAPIPLRGGEGNVGPAFPSLGMTAS
jgi:hypothetical protein